MFFGNPETTTGGKALKFYSSVRMDIRRIQTIKNGDEAVGNRTKVKVVKNKMAPPFKTAEFDVLYGEGISKEGSVLDMALQVNVVKKSGSWFTYGGDQLGQGRENVRQFLKDNPELTEEIENKVKAEFGLIEPPTNLPKMVMRLLRLMPQARRRRKRMLASRKQPKARQRLPSQPARRDV